MASLITLKRRIGSIRGTRQITKAMELVSASKLRRAQEQARMSRDYRQAAYEVLAQLTTVREVATHPLFAQRTVHKRLYVAITSNSGLAGAYNANILKLLTQAIVSDRAAGAASSVIAVGSKAGHYVQSLSGVELTAYYPAFGDSPTQATVQPLLNTMIDQYAQAKVDEVVVLYTLARSGIVQEATAVPLLPAHIDLPAATAQAVAALNFEPDVEAVIHAATSRLIEVQLWQMLLESLASEHAMRMLAMKNATDNASELIGDYTLAYNTARQAAITQELSEITGGAEAMKEE